MARHQQQVNTPYGLIIVDLIKCDQCGALVTLLAALGWLQVLNLSEPVETFDGDDDFSGDYCGPECLAETLSDSGVNTPTLATQENVNGNTDG